MDTRRAILGAATAALLAGTAFVASAQTSGSVGATGSGSASGSGAASGTFSDQQRSPAPTTTQPGSGSMTAPPSHAPGVGSEATPSGPGKSGESASRTGVPPAHGLRDRDQDDATGRSGTSMPPSGGDPQGRSAMPPPRSPRG